jgi:hypothetical protein
MLSSCLLAFFGSTPEQFFRPDLRIAAAARSAVKDSRVLRPPAGLPLTAAREPQRVRT